MSSPFGTLRLIANPIAGRGRVRRQVLPALTAELERRGVDFEVRETNGHGHAEELARAAVAEGRRYLAAVGGDGTLHGVVNGLFDGDEPLTDGLVVGAVPAGSGADFTRSVGLRLRPDRAAARLAAPHTMPLDVGVVACATPEGEREHKFVNIAEAGYGAEVLRLANRLPRQLGRVRYLLASWGGIRAVRREPAKVSIDHVSRQEQLIELVVANGQFFGGGMRVAPRAATDDGRFHVLAFTGDRSQVFRLTTQLYQGRHLPHPRISEWQSAWVEIDSERPMRVEADGELLGTTPARFRILPDALTLKV